MAGELRVEPQLSIGLFIGPTVHAIIIAIIVDLPHSLYYLQRTMRIYIYA